MSDYISKSALIEELNRYEKELYKDKRDAIDSDDEMMLFAIQNQETAISRITRSVMHSIPTLDEKEIIRKPMERIVERVEEARQKYQRLVKEQGEKEDEAMNIIFKGVMNIVKEEGGIE